MRHECIGYKIKLPMIINFIYNDIVMHNILDHPFIINLTLKYTQLHILQA